MKLHGVEFVFEVNDWRIGDDDVWWINHGDDDWLTHDDDGVWWLNLDGMVDGDDYCEMLCYMNFQDLCYIVYVCFDMQCSSIIFSAIISLRDMTIIG